MTPPQGSSRLPDRDSMLAFAAAAGITGAAILAYGGTDPWVAEPLACLVLAALVALCIRRTARRLPLPWHPLLWVMLAFGLLVLAQLAAGLSTYPAATWTGLAQLAGPAAVFYLSLFAFRQTAMLRRLATAAWWLTLALSVEAIFQFYSAGGYIYWHRDATYATPFGPYVYHNHFAGCMDLLLPLALAAVLLRRPDGRPKPLPQLWLAGIVPALGLGAVVASRSRGGLMALMAEAVTGIWIFWRAGKLRLRGALLGGGAGLAVAAAANWQPVVERFLALQQGDVSATDRISMVHGCLAIWRAFPWWGSGFGTFAAVYPQFQVVDIGKAVLEAHNEYAQALAETGLAGACVVIAFVVVAIFAYRSVASSGSAALVRRAALIGAIGFLAQSAVDFEFHSPANALLFFLVAAAAAAHTAVERFERERRVQPLHRQAPAPLRQVAS